MGEIVSVVKNVNNDWVIIQNQRGETGLVPCNYIAKQTDASPNSVPDSATSSNYQDQKVRSAYIIQ